MYVSDGLMSARYCAATRKMYADDCRSNANLPSIMQNGPSSNSREQLNTSIIVLRTLHASSAGGGGRGGITRLCHCNDVFLGFLHCIGGVDMRRLIEQYTFI